MGFCFTRHVQRKFCIFLFTFQLYQYIGLSENRVPQKSYSSSWFSLCSFFPLQSPPFPDTPAYQVGYVCPVRSSFNIYINIVYIIYILHINILSIYRIFSLKLCNPIRLSFLEHLPRRIWASNVVQNLAGLTHAMLSQSGNPSDYSMTIPSM